MTDYESIAVQNARARADYEEARRAALEHLVDSGRPGMLNHYLEDPISTNRVRQTIAFLSEIALQCPESRFTDAMTADAVEGLGWILRSCHEALACLDDMAAIERERQRRTVAEAKVSQLKPSS